ncbi:MerR family transcriptional regulator [Lacticaseibacillus zhaodongensis]|uniref:MerR family transcriptional regulator n=1 Tax=Lacticaseibacillus zhaodongensis TaxID=2668065 RepID=UPI0018AF61B9|nr:MerR family transcriptional regulator [Lacticaseibacillus zhaodongensis]
MHYSISEFSALTGVSERTLRYYHSLGLLKPTVAANGYREFSSADADRMQLIQFYTAAGFSLAAVGELLQDDEATRLAKLRVQRTKLLRQQNDLAVLIAQVDSTIANQEDEQMSDSEKFAAFKRNALAENDKRYGDEVSAQWGAAAKMDADQHFAGLDEATYQRSQQVEAELAQALRDAVTTDAAATGAAGEQVFHLHQQWLQIMWPQYELAMHRSLMDMYAADARFGANYDRLGGTGASAFLIAAVRHFAR